MSLKDTDFNLILSELQGSLDKVLLRAELEEQKRVWLGKEGRVKALYAELRTLPAEQRPEIAEGLNQVRSGVEQAFLQAEARLRAADLLASLSKEWLDPSLPGTSLGIGSSHPITLVEQKILSILRPFGFENVYGPEIETEYFCFDALNIPAHHPARDMQDTFYTTDNLVLRTHTTSVQARVLQNGKAPLKVASFGRVYRNEAEDASHQAMFHQFELIWLEEGLTLSHLMGLISHILKGLYGKTRKVRFVPKFYPYTEPSIGPQIDCSMCKGKGCALCGNSGWVTVAGAGMIHHKVLLEFGFDPEKISGFAFGLGSGRLACQAAGLEDGRMLYENDLRR
jgi:phenylalanyl-tRNA synthetase alpha chain